MPQEKFAGFMAVIGAIISALLGFSLLFVSISIGMPGRPLGTIIIVVMLLGLSAYLAMKAKKDLTVGGAKALEHIPKNQWRFIGIAGLSAAVWDFTHQLHSLSPANRTFFATALLAALSSLCLWLSFRKRP